MAEAAACGCALIGYDGLGGRELMDLASEYGVGWSVAVGDWYGFLQGVFSLQQRISQSPDKLAEDLRYLSDQVRSIYSMSAFVRSLQIVLPRIEAQM